MRIVAFDRADGPGLGLVQGADVVDLSAVDPAAPRELGAVLRAGGLPSLQALAERAGAVETSASSDME